jgi:CubicO group peptidase (beta-lactamase class C family)
MSGMPLDLFMQQSIFGPLRMADTGFWVPKVSLIFSSGIEASFTEGVNPGFLVSKDKRDRFAEVYEPTKREPPAPDTPRGSTVAMGGKVIFTRPCIFQP